MLRSFEAEVQQGGEAWDGDVSRSSDASDGRPSSIARSGVSTPALGSLSRGDQTWAAATRRPLRRCFGLPDRGTRVVDQLWAPLGDPVQSGKCPLVSHAHAAVLAQLWLTNPSSPKIAGCQPGCTSSSGCIKTS